MSPICRFYSSWCQLVLAHYFPHKQHFMVFVCVSMFAPYGTWLIATSCKHLHPPLENVVPYYCNPTTIIHLPPKDYNTLQLRIVTIWTRIDCMQHILCPVPVLAECPTRRREFSLVIFARCFITKGYCRTMWHHTAFICV